MGNPQQHSRSIGLVVNEALAEAGISQREASALTGIPLTTLNRRLNTQSPFLVTELESIATLLKTAVSTLFERAERVQAPIGAA